MRRVTEHQPTRRLRASLFDYFAAWLTEPEDAFGLHWDLRRKKLVRLFDAKPICFDHQSKLWQYPDNCERWFTLMEAYDSLGAGRYEAVDVVIDYRVKYDWVSVPHDAYEDWIVMIDIHRGNERLAILFEPAPHRYGRIGNLGRGPGLRAITYMLRSMPHRLIVAATTQQIGDELGVILRLVAP